MSAIKGYRELSQDEVDIVNYIKAHGKELSMLIEKLKDLEADIGSGVQVDGRWLSIGTTDLQTGMMALVRSVAKPTNF